MAAQTPPRQPYRPRYAQTQTNPSKAPIATSSARFYRRPAPPSPPVPPNQPPPPSQPSQPSYPSQPVKRNFSPAVSLVGIVLTSLVLFLGGYFYLQYLQNQNVGESERLEAGEKAKKEQELAQIEENAKNDQIRKLDITNVKKGLSEYFKENKKYPENLEELSPDFLKVIPLDPITKEPYAYVPNEDFTSFTLSAKISDGSSFTVESE